MYLFKVLVSAIVIATVSELAKRFTPLAAILASLPLTSILAMLWLYFDTKDAAKVAALSQGIFWACLPSLLFFLMLPLLLKFGLKFGVAMMASSLIMFIAYSVYVVALGKFGVKL